TRTEAPHGTDLEIFHNQKRAAKAFSDLAQGATGFHIAPRTRQIFSKLRPVLIGWLTTTADPDATLNQFVRFVEAYGLRSLFFELLVENPRLLELFMKTLDASRFAGELLIRRRRQSRRAKAHDRYDAVNYRRKHLGGRCKTAPRRGKRPACLFD